MVAMGLSFNPSSCRRQKWVVPPRQTSGFQIEKPVHEDHSTKKAPTGGTHMKTVLKSRP
jgi:hypothetical protein